MQDSQHKSTRRMSQAEAWAQQQQQQLMQHQVDSPPVPFVPVLSGLAILPQPGAAAPAPALPVHTGGGGMHPAAAAASPHHQTRSIMQPVARSYLHAEINNAMTGGGQHQHQHHQLHQQQQQQSSYHTPSPPESSSTPTATGRTLGMGTRHGGGGSRASPLHLPSSVAAAIAAASMHNSISGTASPSPASPMPFHLTRTAALPPDQVAYLTRRIAGPSPSNSPVPIQQQPQHHHQPQPQPHVPHQSSSRATSGTDGAHSPYSPSPRSLQSSAGGGGGGGVGTDTTISTPSSPLLAFGATMRSSSGGGGTGSRGQHPQKGRSSRAPAAAAAAATATHDEADSSTPRPHSSTPRPHSSTPRPRSSNVRPVVGGGSSRGGSQTASPMPLHAGSVSAAGSVDPSQSCGWCRRKKRVCDGGIPSCAACASLDLLCSYPHTGLKRGPTAGVLSKLRGELVGLSEQLKLMRERNTKQREIMATLDTANQQALHNFLLHINTNRDQTYLHAFFFQLNNSLFPFLERSEFVIEHSRYAADQSGADPPLAWTLQYAAAVAIGASLSGDMSYARSAASVARIASCALFDQPSYDVLRSFLLLSFYLLGHNQHRRASCCLAVAKRMLFLVPMFHRGVVTRPNPLGPDAPPIKLTQLEHNKLHEQLKLLLGFLEDMLVSSSWWKKGWDEVDQQDEVMLSSDGEGSSGGGNRQQRTPMFGGAGAAAATPSFFPRSFSASPDDLSSLGLGAPMAPGSGGSLNGWSDLLMGSSLARGSSGSMMMAGLHDPLATGGIAAAATSSAAAAPGDEVVVASAIHAAARDAVDFAYNATDFTRLRGGNTGLFEIETGSNGASSPSLFEGSTPLQPLNLVNLKGKVLAELRDGRRGAASSGSGGGGGQQSSGSNTTTSNTSRKRKASNQHTIHQHHQPPSDSESNAAPSEDSASTSLYKCAPPVVSSSEQQAREGSPAAVGGATGADLQLNLMRVMCTLSRIRGKLYLFKQYPQSALHLHKCLAVLSESERRLQHQQMTLAATSPVLLHIRALVLCMKAVSLKLLDVVGAGDGNISLIRAAAKQASLITQQVDLTACPFLAVFYHLISQLHLDYAASVMVASKPSNARGLASVASQTMHTLLLDLQYQERLALRWDFARPLFLNLQQRIWRHVGKFYVPVLQMCSSAASQQQLQQRMAMVGTNQLMMNAAPVTMSTHMIQTALGQILDPNLLQLMTLSIPQVTASGTNSNQSGGSLSKTDDPLLSGSLHSSDSAPFLNPARLDFSTAAPADRYGASMRVGSLHAHPASASSSSSLHGHGVHDELGDINAPIADHLLTGLPLPRSERTNSSTGGGGGGGAGSAAAAAGLDDSDSGAVVPPPRKRHQIWPPNSLANSTGSGYAAAQGPFSSPAIGSYQPMHPFGDALGLSSAAMQARLHSTGDGGASASMYHSPQLFSNSAAASHRLSKHVEQIQLPMSSRAVDSNGNMVMATSDGISAAATCTMSSPTNLAPPTLLNFLSGDLSSGSIAASAAAAAGASVSAANGAAGATLPSMAPALRSRPSWPLRHVSDADGDASDSSSVLIDSRSIMGASPTADVAAAAAVALSQPNHARIISGNFTSQLLSGTSSSPTVMTGTSIDEQMFLNDAY